MFSIDRLARDLCDLQSFKTLNDKGVSISFLSELLTFTVDTYDGFGSLQLRLMGAFAEFERNIIRKRRKKTVAEETIIDLKQQGKRVSEIASALGVSRMTVYRALDSAA